MSHSPTTWLCPSCGRRVPRRVERCFCGIAQKDAVQREQREVARSGAGLPRDVVGLLALVVLVGAYGIYGLLREEPDRFAGARRLGAVLALPETPPDPLQQRRAAPPATPTAAPAEAPTPPPVTTQPTAAPVVETPAPHAPPAAAGPQPPLPAAAAPADDGLDPQRAAGLRAYEEELRRLASLANRLAVHNGVFRKQCVGGQRVGQSTSNCDDLEATVKKLFAEIQKGLAAAEDEARRAWLSPGSVRDAYARSFFGTPEWEALARAARDPGQL